MSSKTRQYALLASDPATLRYYEYNPAKARALLREAGHPDGIEIPIASPALDKLM